MVLFAYSQVVCSSLLKLHACVLKINLSKCSVLFQHTMGMGHVSVTLLMIFDHGGTVFLEQVDSLSFHHQVSLMVLPNKDCRRQLVRWQPSWVAVCLGGAANLPAEVSRIAHHSQIVWACRIYAVERCDVIAVNMQIKVEVHLPHQMD